MLNLILNTCSLTSADRRRAGPRRLATQLGHPDKTSTSGPPAGVCVRVCLRVSVCACVYFVCILCVAVLLDRGAICPLIKGELEGAMLQPKIKKEIQTHIGELNRAEFSLCCPPVIDLR